MVTGGGLGGDPGGVPVGAGRITGRGGVVHVEHGQAPGTLLEGCFQDRVRRIIQGLYPYRLLTHCLPSTHNKHTVSLQSHFVINVTGPY